jgi:hypothetical protein
VCPVHARLPIDLNEQNRPCPTLRLGLRDVSMMQPSGPPAGFMFRSVEPEAEPEDRSQLLMTQRFSPEATPYLYDQRAAFALLRSRRWRNGLFCPRCGSRNVREVRTIRVLEAFSCSDCRYNFTTTACTFFHSSRTPVYVRLQLVAAFEFFDASPRKTQLGKLFGMKQTTIQRQIQMLDALPRTPFAFSVSDHLPFEEFPSVIAFLEQPGIAFSPEGLAERLDQLLAPVGRPMRRTAGGRHDGA